MGSPRGRAKDVNFYDDLHRRYIEVTGAHGNMLFEPAHTRLAGNWDINKAQDWLLAAFAGFCVLFPMLFFRYARALWLAMDCRFDQSLFADLPSEEPHARR